ncbi:HlyD family efflux transporter periplasmic adaptor subunit [Ectothiorhodospiraceae bacterium 2226]|nr:HlyD family efflux transporter periplasmic adaptor subunit [Ectothiorhodospiraceae bacterium 2226]
MKLATKKPLIGTLALAGLLIVALVAWRQYVGQDDSAGLASGNGRIEAVEISIAARSAGRVQEILVREGELVTAGQVVARMDTNVLAAQLHQAEAQLRQAESAVATARSQVGQREAEKAAAQALLEQREAEHRVAESRLARTSRLARQGAISQQDVDDDEARVAGAAAAVSAVRAQIAAADAAIVTARSQLAGAEQAVEAAQAGIEQIRADLAETELRAPRAGRIEYLVAQSGEVVGAGGRVMNMVDLSDVYMTFFLPTAAAGRIAMGSEVRLVLDAAPEYVFPAHVSFIADVAQFTPKTVETALERERLMFRVRARIPPELLQAHIHQVKTGLPGVAYVRLDTSQPWPARLQVRLPE